MWLVGEQQRHVIVQRVFAVDVVSLVLQQPACLVQHPIRRVDGDYRLAGVVLDVNRDVKLRPLPVLPEIGRASCRERVSSPV